MNLLIRRAANNLWYGIFPQLENLGMKHGIATRLGGISASPYASLNMGLRSGDDIQKVIINRQRFYEALEVDMSRVVAGQQIHGDNVAVVTNKDLGKGSISLDGIAGTDALVTNLPDIPLMVFFADCVPLLFVDPVHGAIGACHAGWRGSVAKIATKVVETMNKHFGTEPANCHIGIGPSIGQCCYEVDEAVISHLRSSFIWWEETVKPHGQKWKLDLSEVNRRQLLEIGVAGQNIFQSNACTACNTSLFFSHRAEHGHTGVLAALITLQR